MKSTLYNKIQQDTTRYNKIQQDTTRYRVILYIFQKGAGTNISACVKTKNSESAARVLTKHFVSVKIDSRLNRFAVQHFNYAVLMSLYRNLSAALFCSLRFIKSSGRCPTALHNLFCAVSQSVAIAFFAYYTFESKMYGVFLSYGRFSVQ